MKFQGAVIREQGVSFAIVIVRSQILNDKSEADKTIRAFGPVFPRIPIVLMAQDSRGLASYYGRPDIVRFMANVLLSVVPWKEYTIN
jgi:hypothetical protein